VQESAAEAPDAVLTMLARPVLTDLAAGNGGVVLSRAFATVADALPDDPTSPAGERIGAPALEQANSGRCQVQRT